MGNLTGTTLGRYQVGDRLGQGGMAEVYRAYHPLLDRYVAIKVLHSFLITEDSSRARFQREARAVAALRHPNIVQVLDFDIVDETSFMVMELIDGPDLKTVLQQQAQVATHLPLERVAEIVRAIGSALAYAHQHGIIHRDIKPHNILIRSDGQPLLTDFGIAKLASGTLSSSGLLTGTPAYMSPEQGQGVALDSRADLYSFGVVLYEMLTGRVPFDADTPFSVVLKHIQEPLPAPRSIVPRISLALEAVVQKALAKAPEDRYQTADEIVAAIHEAIATIGSGSRSVDTPSAPLPQSVHRAIPPVAPVPSLGAQLVALRKLLGLSQAQVAEFIRAPEDVAAPVERIQHWEHDRRRPRTRRELIAIIAAMRKLNPTPITLERVEQLIRTYDPHIPLTADERGALFPEPGPAPAGSAAGSLGEKVLHVVEIGPSGDGAPTPVLPGSLTPAISNNLPQQWTSFVGRQAELATIRSLLATTRLVTLIGAGGTGKTRLALQVAAGLGEHFPDGIWLVDLAPLSDATLVAQAVAAVLSVREEPNRSLLLTLSEALREKRLLLLLDNCEHLVTACADVVTSLLRRCPTVHMLATSREALGIVGETIQSVPSLAVPDLHDVPSSAALAHYEAVQLFLDRARAIQPQFTLTDRHAIAVAQICRHLDGIPLAIELAAVRVQGLSVEQIAARLDDCFRLLTQGSRTALPRHQTLRATIDWSYNLLGADERLLLRQLAVFAGGWTLEAAEAICREAPGSNLMVLDSLLQLVNKSLVVAEEDEGQARYRLLETIRQYAQEKLRAAGEAEAIQTHHQDWYLHLAEEAAPQLRGADQTIWLARLEKEHDNLRAALNWALDHGNAEGAVRLSAALWRFWWTHGYITEGRRWLEKALAHQSGAPTAGRAQALNAAGILAHEQGDYVRAPALFEESLRLRRALGDTRGIAESLNSLGVVALSSGDYDRARAFYEEVLVLRRALGDQHGLAVVLNNLGLVACNQGDYARAEQLYEESLALYRATGDKQGVAWSLNNLGEVVLGQGNYARAGQLYKEGLVLCREIGDKQGIAVCLDGLAGVAGAQGAPEIAARLLGASAVLRKVLGAEMSPANRATYDRMVDNVRAQLDAPAWAAAWAAGQALTMEQAIAVANAAVP